MPEVSVIIPTYNRSDFLYGAVASALSQTFQDFEIIVVDDASQDDTGRTVSGFNDTRIKYIRHETNKGGGAARNTGIRSAAGRYIAFLDDDDEWYPDKLRLQMERIESSSERVGGVYTGYLVVDRTSGKIRGQKIPRKAGDLYRDLLKANPIGGSSMMLLKRECFDRVGLFDESLPCFQDRDLWIRVGKHFHYTYVKEPLVKYYNHENKIWRNPHAIERGLERMLRKYGSSRDIRRNVSRYYRKVGVGYCRDGDMLKGRQALQKAVGLYPWELRHYFSLSLSLLGPEWFVKIEHTKQKVMDGLRQVWALTVPRKAE